MSRESAETINATQFILLLHSVPHLGEKTLTRLLHLLAQQRLRPEECLQLTAEEWHRFYELHPKAADYLAGHPQALRARSAEEARILRHHQIALLTVESATYPPRLERFDDAPPPVLYAYGNLGLLTENPATFTFALATSNDPAQAALDYQDVVATRLMQEGGIVVTGHDREPYQRAALSAQRLGKPIVYVFDRGLREALGPEFDRPPFAAARIRDAVFDPVRDLALSPFRLDDHGIGANNRRRDTLIFALADRIVAIDVTAGGSMAKACRRTHEQGRAVSVCEGGREGNATLRAMGIRRWEQ